LVRDPESRSERNATMRELSKEGNESCGAPGYMWGCSTQLGAPCHCFDSECWTSCELKACREGLYACEFGKRERRKLQKGARGVSKETVRKYARQLVQVSLAQCDSLSESNRPTRGERGEGREGVPTRQHIVGWTTMGKVGSAPTIAAITADAAGEGLLVPLVQ
jgi:hypothetical protein